MPQDPAGGVQPLANALGVLAGVAQDDLDGNVQAGLAGVAHHRLQSLGRQALASTRCCERSDRGFPRRWSSARQPAAHRPVDSRSGHVARCQHVQVMPSGPRPWDIAIARSSFSTKFESQTPKVRTPWRRSCSASARTSAAADPHRRVIHGFRQNVHAPLQPRGQQGGDAVRPGVFQVAQQPPQFRGSRRRRFDRSACGRLSRSSIGAGQRFARHGRLRLGRRFPPAQPGDARPGSPGT